MARNDDVFWSSFYDLNFTCWLPCVRTAEVTFRLSFLLSPPAGRKLKADNFIKFPSLNIILMRSVIYSIFFFFGEKCYIFIIGWAPKVSTL